MDRRDFFKKAGLVGGLGAAGALTLNKEYVKPVVRLLEPSAAYAQTAPVNTASATFTVSPMNLTVLAAGGLPFTTVLNLLLDIPGTSPPIPGSTFDASVTITNMSEVTPWGTGIGFLPLASLTSGVIDNVGVASATSQVSLSLTIAAAPTLNGTALPGVPFIAAVAAYVGAPVPPGNAANFCINVTADQGTSTGGVGYPAQTVGSWCVDTTW